MSHVVTVLVNGQPFPATLVSVASEGVAGQTAPSRASVVGVLDSGGIVRFIRTGDTDNLAGSNFLETVLAGINSGGNADRLRVDTSKNLMVGIRDANGSQVLVQATGASDAMGTNAPALQTANYLLGFNGVNWDRVKTSSVAGDGGSSPATGVVNTLGFDYGYNGATWDRNMSLGDDADGVGTFPRGRQLVNGRQYAYNGAGWDRVRNNLEGTLLASAARTVATSSATMTNHNATGVRITLDVTAASGTGGIQIRPEGYDIASGKWVPINVAPAAVTTVSTTVYVVYPNASGGYPTQSTPQPLPRTWRVTAAHVDGSSYTYSVGYSLIL